MTTLTELIAVYRSRSSLESNKKDANGSSVSAATASKHSMEELDKMMTWTLSKSETASPFPGVMGLKPHLFSLIKKDSVKKALQGTPLIFSANTPSAYSFTDRTFAFLLLIIRKELLVYYKSAIDYVELHSDFHPKPPSKLDRFAKNEKEECRTAVGAA
jgi:hypothetical protein